MSDTLTLAWALGTGVALGAFFFAGLWWTVRMGAASKRPALLFLASVLLRTSIVLAGLYFVTGGHWSRTLAYLVGFLIARLVVTKLTGPPLVPRTSVEKEVGHASQSR